MTDETRGSAESAVQTPANNGTDNASDATPVPELHKETTSEQSSRWQKILSVLNWMPPWCRWDLDSPPVFSVPMNILFAFAGTFTVANLYYNHPILNVLAHDFHVPYETASRVPTLMQAGYATGLLFLCPLGDVFKRRQFVLIMVLFTATLW